MHYLTSVTEVKEAVRTRRREQGTVRSVLDQYVEAHYGVPNFSRLVQSGIASSVKGSAMDLDSSHAVLARQVPGLCTEDVASYLLSLRLGLKPCSLAFTRDSFHSGSNDKMFRLKLPVSTWSKKGNLVLNHHDLVGIGDYTHLDMVRLDRIMFGDISIPEHHRTMQSGVFSHFAQPYLWSDISQTWGELLAQVNVAKRAPHQVWRCDSNNKDTLTDGGYTSDEARNLTVRPYSKWYYFLYLAMFLDGTFVLLETYDNEEGGVPEARRLFEEAMGNIQRATGYMPLVVKTFPLRRDMMYVNQHIIDEPTKAGEQLSRLRYWSDDTCAMTRWFADQVIQFGRC